MRGFIFYPTPILRATLKRYQQDHPEVSISRLCTQYLAQYLYDQGYDQGDQVQEERETNP